MATNGHGSMERRLDRLERADQENTARWWANDARWHRNDLVISRMLRALERHEARHRELQKQSDSRWAELQRQSALLQRQSDLRYHAMIARLDASLERVDAAMRIWRRKMEH